MLLDTEESGMLTPTSFNRSEYSQLTYRWCVMTSSSSKDLDSVGVFSSSCFDRLALGDESSHRSIAAKVSSDSFWSSSFTPIIFTLTALWTSIGNFSEDFRSDWTTASTSGFSTLDDLDDIERFYWVLEEQRLTSLWTCSTVTWPKSSQIWFHEQDLLLRWNDSSSYCQPRARNLNDSPMNDETQSRRHWPSSSSSPPSLYDTTLDVLNRDEGVRRQV